MQKSNFRVFTLMSVGLLMAWSCGTSSVDEATSEDEFVGELEEEVVNEGEKVVYYGTPSLVEVASIMEASGAQFTPELLNDPEMSSKYTTNDAKAINLGVYGADLAYAAMFEHSQESINYLKTVKGMSDDLGLSGAFESDLLNSIESNITNRDSLLDVVTDFYWSADAYLQDNNRASVASLIIAGGWIESLYLACNMSQNTPDNEEIKIKISEQKLILKNLVLYLSQAGQGEPAVEKMNSKLMEIQKIYEGIEITHDDNIETSMSEGEMVIENETEVSLNEDVFNELCSKFGEIRDEIVQ